MGVCSYMLFTSVLYIGSPAGVGAPCPRHWYTPPAGPLRVQCAYGYGYNPLEQLHAAQFAKGEISRRLAGLVKNCGWGGKSKQITDSKLGIRNEEIPSEDG